MQVLPLPSGPFRCWINRKVGACCARPSWGSFSTSGRSMAVCRWKRCHMSVSHSCPHHSFSMMHYCPQRRRFHFKFGATPRKYSVSGSDLKAHFCLYFRHGDKGYQLDMSILLFKKFFSFSVTTHAGHGQILCQAFHYFCLALVLLY